MSKTNSLPSAQTQHNSYAQATNPLPTKKQAILLPVDEETPLIDYFVAIGRKIGPSNIISASKISKQRICIYLLNEATADLFIRDHKNIIVNGKQIVARKLIAPAKKLVLSNIHPYLPNNKILQALRNHDLKPVSNIHNLHVGLTTSTLSKDKSELYSHITSFRRGVYIEPNEEIVIPDSLLINHDNEYHRIFINEKETEQSCFICKNTGHTSASCPIGATDPVPQPQQQSSDSSYEERLIQARIIRDANQSKSDSQVTTTKSQPQSSPICDAPSIESNSQSSQPVIPIEEIVTSNSNLTQDEPEKKSNSQPTQPEIPIESSVTLNSNLTQAEPEMMEIPTLDTSANPKRPLRRDSNTESNGSDSIAKKMLKPDNISLLTDEDTNVVSQYFKSNPDQMSKLDLTLNDLTEFFSDLQTYSAKDMINQILPGYTNDPLQFLEMLSSLRPLLKGRSRIARMIKKFTTSSDEAIIKTTATSSVHAVHHPDLHKESDSENDNFS